MPIWVLVADYGTEGLDDPIMAFHDEGTGVAALHLIGDNPSAMSMRLIEVPIWLESPKKSGIG